MRTDGRLLTSCGISPDGFAIRLGFADAGGKARHLDTLRLGALEQSTNPDTLMTTLRVPDGLSVCLSMRADRGDALGATLSQPHAPAMPPAFN